MGGDVVSEKLFSPSKLFDHVFHFSCLIRVYLKVDVLSGWYLHHLGVLHTWVGVPWLLGEWINKWMQTHFRLRTIKTHECKVRKYRCIAMQYRIYPLDEDIFFGLTWKSGSNSSLKLNHRLSWFKYPTQIIVAFLLNFLMTISKCVASIFSHEWEIVIVTMLREFWMHERKLEAGRDNKCYILLIFYLLCIFCYSLLIFGLQCTSIEIKYLSILCNWLTVWQFWVNKM